MYPIGILQSLVGAAMALRDAVNQVAQNNEALLALCDRVETLTTQIAGMDVSGSTALAEYLERLVTTLNNCMQLIQSVDGNTFIENVVNGRQLETRIGDVNDALDEARASLQLVLVVTPKCDYQGRQVHRKLVRFRILLQCH